VGDAVDTVGFRRGDPEAIRGVYRAYGGMVFSVAHKVLGNRGMAEEATQQAFVQAWRAAQSFDPSREIGPWLATIARRVAIDIHRREARRPRESLDESSGHPALVVAPPEADAAFDVWEVRQAVASLPPEEREVVRLQHVEALTHAEIAERMHIPVGTVKSRSFRAHRRLAARLGHLRDPVVGMNQEASGNVLESNDRAIGGEGSGGRVKE
jgi:RNA polymerase sigma factor (sigma-70 family)